MQLEQQSQSYRELIQTEQYLCPANRAHKLGNIEKLEYHIHRCKELKYTNKQNFVYYCQFFAGHLFLNKEDRDAHEEICKIGFGLQQKRDPIINKYAIIQPSLSGTFGQLPESTKSGSTAANSSEQMKLNVQKQQQNYEYALKKGLIKNKKQIQEETPPNSFEFTKDFKKVDEQIKLQLQKHLLQHDEPFQQLLFRDDSYLVLSVNSQLITFLHKRLPFNEFFRKRAFYEEEYRNTSLDILSNKLQFEANFMLIGLIPMDRAMRLINFQDYNQFLSVFQAELICETEIEINTSVFHSSIIDGNIYIVLCKGLDFAEEFKGTNLALMTCIYTQFVVFKFPYNDYLKQRLEGVVNLIELEKIQPMKELKDKDFQGQLDSELEKKIGQTKGAIEQLNKRHGELDNEIKTLVIQNSKYAEEKRIVQKNEKDLELQNKMLKKQLDSYYQKDKKYQMELEKKLHEQIISYFNEKEQEFQSQLNSAIEITKEIEETLQSEMYMIVQRRDEKKQLKGDLERIEKLHNQRLKQREEQLKKQKNCVKLISKSPYYFGQKIIFNAPEQIKCSACKKLKSNVIFEPCHHCNLCRICYEKFEMELPHICYKCQNPIKRVIHLRWESEIEKIK